MKTLRATFVSLAVVALAGCKQGAPEVHGAVPVPGAAAPKPVPLTFLVTGAENGYLLATPEESALRGGAAEVLGRWVAKEGHCAGPLAPDGAAPCADSSTIVVSTGDNANGQAISSYFKGESAGQVMRLMGYAASAFGNRELDWARPQFVANSAAGGFPYLAANLKAKDDAGRQLGLAPFRVVSRRGVKVGLVGLAARKATVTPMPGRMNGIEFLADAQALAEAIPAARAAGATVIAIISDGCLDEAPELLAGHPDWNVAFFAGRQCDAPFPESVGSTKLVYPGRHFNTYARVAVTVDGASGRVTSVEAKSVDVVSGGDAPAPEARAAELIAGWKKKLDGALGDRIGFSKTGVDQQSKEMAAWLTQALRERFKTDVGLINRKAVRQGLPVGAITGATVYDLVPFDNEVVTVKLSGEALLAALGNVEARISGVKPKGEGWVDATGAAVDPKKTYTVATIDYLYLGGDGFQLNKVDATPTQTGVSVQAALIAWTRERKSDEKKPLETLLGAK